MTMQALVFSFVAFLVGAVLSVQAPINAVASARIGHPLAGATLSFVVGTIFLLAITLFVTRGDIAWGNVAALPPMLWLGGILGAIYITVAIVLTPVIGVGALIALAIAGQITAGLLLDHYGFLGIVHHEITAGRVLGAVFVVVGALMVRFL